MRSRTSTRTRTGSRSRSVMVTATRRSSWTTSRLTRAGSPPRSPTRVRTRSRSTRSSTTASGCGATHGLGLGSCSRPDRHGHLAGGRPPRRVELRRHVRPVAAGAHRRGRRAVGARQRQHRARTPLPGLPRSGDDAQHAPQGQQLSEVLRGGALQRAAPDQARVVPPAPPVARLRGSRGRRQGTRFGRGTGRVAPPAAGPRARPRCRAPSRSTSR